MKLTKWVFWIGISAWVIGCIAGITSLIFSPDVDTFQAWMLFTLSGWVLAIQARLFMLEDRFKKCQSQNRSKLSFGGSSGTAGLWENR